MIKRIKKPCKQVDLNFPMWMLILKEMSYLQQKNSVMNITIVFKVLRSNNPKCTYSHVNRIIDELEDKKFIRSNKCGRVKYLNLTQKGLLFGELMFKC